MWCAGVRRGHATKECTARDAPTNTNIKWCLQVREPGERLSLTITRGFSHTIIGHRLTYHGIVRALCRFTAQKVLARRRTEPQPSSCASPALGVQGSATQASSRPHK